MMSFEGTFNNAASEYDKSRPNYVKEIYDAIFRYKQLNAESNVLEIGIGTGKASKPILDTGCQLIGIEPGDNLVSIANENLKKYSNVSIYTQTLQDYICPPESFDLIYAATAFHWIPEEYGYKRVYELLKHNGVFARFAYHAGRDRERKELTAQIQELYGRYMNCSGIVKEYSEDDARKLADIAKNYGFSNVEYKLFHVNKDFTADEYMELLRTYPDHMAIEEENRKRLFDGIHSAIQRNGGIITIQYTMDLQLARKI